MYEFLVPPTNFLPICTVFSCFFFSQWEPGPFLFISFNINWVKNISSSLFLLLFSHFSQILIDGLEAYLSPIYFPDICILVIFSSEFEFKLFLDVCIMATQFPISQQTVKIGCLQTHQVVHSAEIYS